MTLAQLNSFFFKLIAQILGLDPTLPTSQDKVRISWPTGGAPSWKITDNICFLQINNQENGISKQFDTKYTVQSGYNLNENITYTKVHRVDMVLYGPNSLENAEIIKNALYTSSTYRVLLQQNNMSVVQDVNTPIRSPELFQGQWWERANFFASFNELITTTSTIQAIQTINVTNETDSITQIDSLIITN